MFKIVETDNFGGDYPAEKFVNIPYCGTKEQAQSIADAINKVHCSSQYDTRFWKVVEGDYKLQPGFEP